MKANEYVKEYGWDVAKKALEVCDYGYGVDLSELKRLVDSWELVEYYSGLSSAKAVAEQYWNSGVGSAMIVSMELQQAIKDVESCQ